MDATTREDKDDPEAAAEAEQQEPKPAADQDRPNQGLSRQARARAQGMSYEQARAALAPGAGAAGARASGGPPKNDARPGGGPQARKPNRDRNGSGGGEQLDRTTRHHGDSGDHGSEDEGLLGGIVSGVTGAAGAAWDAVTGLVGGDGKDGSAPDGGSNPDGGQGPGTQPDGGGGGTPGRGPGGRPRPTPGGGGGPGGIPGQTPTDGGGGGGPDEGGGTPEEQQGGGKDEGDKDDKPKDEESPQAPLPDVGSFGMLKESVEAGGETYDKGTAVKVVSAKREGLELETRGGGKNQKIEAPVEVFKKQPELAQDDNGEHDGYSYEKYEGQLFLGKPEADDVDQGSLGDCYLIAAMGAIAAQRPEVVENMVSWDEGSQQYTVTFHQRTRDGFEPVEVKVDPHLPSRSKQRPAYAMNDEQFDPEDRALWPAVVEKAYAKWEGGGDGSGYGAIEGGRASKAMEQMTGAKSDYERIPQKDQEILQKFKKFEKEGKSVTCGTVDEVERRNAEVLDGEGEGPYRGFLPGSDDRAHIVPDSLVIEDSEGNAGTARDDGQGALDGPGVAKGEVKYEKGAVSLTYESDKEAPEEASDLVATYDDEAILDSSLNIYGNHAYIFVKVENGKLVFQNPWGPAERNQPAPVAPSDFRKYFTGIGVNAGPGGSTS